MNVVFCRPVTLSFHLRIMKKKQCFVSDCCIFPLHPATASVCPWGRFITPCECLAGRMINCPLSSALRQQQGTTSDPLMSRRQLISWRGLRAAPAPLQLMAAAQAHLRSRFASNAMEYRWFHHHTENKAQPPDSFQLKGDVWLLSWLH